MVKTIFFGTHQFAASILEGLVKRHIADVVLVLTQPDRPIGKRQALQPSPVKLLAKKYSIPVEQPASLKTYSLLPTHYSLGIVAQYGLLIPKHILDALPHGVLNIHTSLLPKYRGASPIQTAIMNGDTETGVTIMKVDEGLDTGPILVQKSLAIGADEIAPEIEAKITALAIDALAEYVPAYLTGTLSPRAQDNARASVCKELKRDDGRVDWTLPATTIYNRYRAFHPWPGLWTAWNGKRLKLLRVALADDVLLPAGLAHAEGRRLLIGCGAGSIEALELQLEGSRAQDTPAFLHGHRTMDGARLS